MAESSGGEKVVDDAVERGPFAAPVLPLPSAWAWSPFSRGQGRRHRNRER